MAAAPNPIMNLCDMNLGIDPNVWLEMPRDDFEGESMGEGVPRGNGAGVSESVRKRRKEDGVIQMTAPQAIQHAVAQGYRMLVDCGGDWFYFKCLGFTKEQARDEAVTYRATCLAKNPPKFTAGNGRSITPNKMCIILDF
jgi:hypothetical protein